jgi:hypothetical protein
VRSLIVGVALSVVAFTSVAGSAHGSGPAYPDPTFQQRMQFLLGEHGYPARLIAEIGR